jgi:hypothetical protein
LPLANLIFIEHSPESLPFETVTHIHMERKCLECAEPLHGRSDQKYCSDQCRSSYNNRLFGDVNRYIKKVNYILRKNRKILARLNPEGKAKVHRQKLILNGFNFKYHTSTYRTKAGKEYYFCYEQGYLLLEDDYVALVRRQRYME